MKIILQHQNYLQLQAEFNLVPTQKACHLILVPGSTLHGYLSKILARSCQDLGKILAKIVTRYCQELQDAIVRSYQESHVSKKNLTKKPNMARKI